MVELIRPNPAWGAGTWNSGTWAAGLYELPPGLRLTKVGFSQRVDTAKRAFSDGRFSFGDEVDDREAVVEGFIEASSRAAMLALIDELHNVCQVPGQRLRIDNGRFLQLTRLKEFENEPPPTWNRTVSEVRIVWQCDDPFWKSESTEVRTVTLTGNTTFNLDLTGLPPNLRGQFPVISITAPNLQPIASAKLENLSDGGLQFRLSDPGLISNVTAVIDCRVGTVSIAGANRARYFEGEFLRLVDGVNQLRYTGTACTLRFEWRHQWL